MIAIVLEWRSTKTQKAAFARAQGVGSIVSIAIAIALPDLLTDPTGSGPIGSGPTIGSLDEIWVWFLRRSSSSLLDSVS